MRGAAARDFGRGQGGEVCASPQGAVPWRCTWIFLPPCFCLSGSQVALRSFAWGTSTQILPSFASARSMKNMESRKWGQKDKHQLDPRHGQIDPLSTAGKAGRKSLCADSRGAAAGRGPDRPERPKDLPGLEGGGGVWRFKRLSWSDHANDHARRSRRARQIPCEREV
jgi:hypothetical protein